MFRRTVSSSVPIVMMTRLARRMQSSVAPDQTIQSLEPNKPPLFEDAHSHKNIETPSLEGDESQDWRLPSRVVVGPHVFRVVTRDGPFIAEGGTDLLQGEINHLAGEIRLSDAYPQRLYCTLWHEVLHACDDLAGTSLEEAQVDRLANVVALVLMQNPALRGGGFTRAG